ncbi:hypothetical protein SAMN05428978_10618 [Nitrosomonas sp. Nm34]|nr:hypothetical protein SAMN05428978_10618 [Nitrosomonas sp. Nm34]
MRTGEFKFEVYFYKVNKRQTTIVAELLERSNKRSINEALAAAYPRATYQIQSYGKQVLSKKRIANSASMQTNRG